MTTTLRRSRNQLTIDNATDDTRLHALRTLPINPEYVTINFTAGEIIPEIQKERIDNESYIAICKQHNIIPFSYLNLQYYPTGNFFKPDTSTNTVISFYREASEDTKKKSIEALVTGGRMEKINIEIKFPAPSGFKTLKDEFLDKLVERNYKLSSGYLWLSHNRFTGYSEGEEMACGLVLGTEIELRDPSDLHLESQHKLRKWFTNLKRYHRTRQAQ